MVAAAGNVSILFRQRQFGAYNLETRFGFYIAVRLGLNSGATTLRIEPFAPESVRLAIDP